MGREAAFTAASNSLCSRIPPLLVSFNALVLRIAGQGGQSGKIPSRPSNPPPTSSARSSVSPPDRSADIEDGLWRRIEPLLPVVERCFRYPGRIPLDHRKVICGILFVAYTGIRWDSCRRTWSSDQA